MLAAFLSLALLANVGNALFIDRFHRESAFTHFLYFASKQLKAMMYLFFPSTYTSVLSKSRQMVSLAGVQRCHLKLYPKTH